ncbi:MAG: hypothetical protein K6D94_06125 [Clostridiales bacterium]|nr:hypothetical protein [Clostridiales bacterium]
MSFRYLKDVGYLACMAALFLLYFGVWAPLALIIFIAGATLIMLAVIRDNNADKNGREDGKDDEDNKSAR